MAQVHPFRAPTPLPDLDERETRVQLAACYRLVAHFGMDDLVFTHISARVPGSPDHFLINPYGMRFDEITASSLVKIDHEGNLVEDSPWPVNQAGFVIHSAIHMARRDVACVLHTHTRAGIAVSCLEEGLLPLNQHAMLFKDRVAYHDYEGIALELGERERLVADLGEMPALILRNHGLLTVGRTVPEAFAYMYYLEQSCRIQLDVMAAGRPSLPPEDVQRRTAAQWTRDGRPLGMREWPALLRLLDQKDASYRT
jgi:ribulose-5-phosphate 4-epimerase/fuculose-1-phosphate aldolase